MAEFAAKFIVPYDVWASNYVDVSGVRGEREGTGRGVRGRTRHGARVCSATAAAAEPLYAVTAGRVVAGAGGEDPPVVLESPLSSPRMFSRGWGDGTVGSRGCSRAVPLSPALRFQLITEQADIPLSRGAEVKGKCGTNESELEISWLEQAYTLKLFFLKVRGSPRTPGAGGEGCRAVPPWVLSGPLSAGGAQHLPGAGGVLETQPDPVHLRHRRAHLLQGRRQP